MDRVRISLTQRRASWLMVGLIFAVSGSLVGLVVMVHLWKGTPIVTMMRDPLATYRAPFYVGFFSQLGLFMWTAAATVCMFTTLVLAGRVDRLGVRQFLFFSGLLSLLLGLDDAFLLHEKFFPEYLSIPERAVYIGYAFITLLYLIWFRRILIRTELVLLALAFGFFGVSLVLDILHIRSINPYLFEDGAKLTGIVSWLVYFVRTCLAAVALNAAPRGGIAQAGDKLAGGGAA